ncbi:MAG: ABC transporter ATP-binding protein, partial [Pseudomonadota bacterium]|nr:ABC transporter ATP-binding protein [Pseudomonadota bacterium]
STFDMQVQGQETSGDETFIHGIVDGNRWVIRRPGMVSVTPGQHLSVSVRTDDILRFGVA